MRRRSLAGPLMLLLIGGLFLWNNFHPQASFFEILANYWPFLLILWGVLRLIEVAWPRQGEWRGSFSGGEVVLIVLVCIIGWGFQEGYRHGIRWRASGLEMFGDTYNYPVNATASAQGVKRIVFDSPAGDLKIIGADTSEVEVNGHKIIRAFGRSDADRTNGQTPLDLQREGDSLVVRTNQDRAPDTQRVSDDLEVTVPRGLTVEAHIRRGDFDIADIAGDVDLAAGRGDARLARVGGNARLALDHSGAIRGVDMRGRVDIEGQGSDLSLENVAGPVSIRGGYSGTMEFKNLAHAIEFQGSRSTQLHAEGVPGRITMDMGQFTGAGVSGPVRLVTRSRDIHISGFTQALTLDTERGDIELQPSQPMPAIEARSGNGDIEVVLPGHAAFQLDATAEHGDAVNDYGPPLEKQVAGHTETVKGGTAEGPMVRLTSRRGSVTVRKGSAAPMQPLKTPPAESPKDLKDSEVKL